MNESRRRFLRQIALAGLGTIVAPAAIFGCAESPRDRRVREGREREEFHYKHRIPADGEPSDLIRLLDKTFADPTKISFNNLTNYRGP